MDGRIADTRQGRREALDLTLGQAREKFEEMRDYLDQLTGINLKVAREAHQAAGKAYRNTLTILISITGSGLVIGLLLMWRLTQGITKSLKKVISDLNQGSEQDFEVCPALCPNPLCLTSKPSGCRRENI